MDIHTRSSERHSHTWRLGRELGCGLSGLRVLRVTRCSLDSLDGTFGLASLAELYAAFNRVQDIGYLACLPSIEHIDLRG